MMHSDGQSDEDADASVVAAGTGDDATTGACDGAGADVPSFTKMN